MGVIYRLMLTLILSLHLITIYAENENPFFFPISELKTGFRRYLFSVYFRIRKDTYGSGHVTEQTVTMVMNLKYTRTK